MENYILPRVGVNLHEIGAGPLIFVLIGNTAIFPICRTDGSSLNAEWYAFYQPTSLARYDTYWHCECVLYN
jgi:hypothetical protein